MLHWIWECRYLFKILMLFPISIYSEVRLLDYMLVLFLSFWGTFILFPIPTNLHSHRWCTRVLFSPQPHQHVLFSCVLTVAILSSVRWCLIVVLICVSLVSDVWAPFHVPSLAVYMSSLENVYLAHLSII